MAGGGGRQPGAGDEAAALKPAANLTGQSAEVYSNYTRLGEHLRLVTPPDLQCSVFCGGRRCRYDSADAWTAADMAVDGVYSHWITRDILAMARPNTALIKSKHVVQQFLDLELRTLINLQQAGEHASCGGCDLGDSGFSYEPTTFMEHGIFFYNFGLRDFGQPALDGLLDIIKVMAFALTEGRVAIHCHAGLGRTGVLIACYLVYSLRARANDAIRYVRHKRPNSVQTSGQIKLVQEFEQYILPELYVFCNKEFLKEKKNIEFTLQVFLGRQRTVLHGYEARALRHIPKIIYIICERLLRLTGCGGGVASPHLLAPLDINYSLGFPAFTSFFLSAQYDHDHSRGGSVSYSAPLSLGSPSLSTSQSVDAVGGSSMGSGNGSGGFNEADEDNQQFSEGHVSMPSSAMYHRRTRVDKQSQDIPSVMSGFPDQTIDALLNDGVQNEVLADNLCYQELSSQSDLRRQARRPVTLLTASEVYEALVQDHSVLDADHHKRTRSYRHELNIRQTAWERLATETSTAMLTGLLFAWLQQLKTPLLSVDELSYLVLAAHRPEVVLRRMDKDVCYTLEYIVRFVARLHPLSSQQQRDILLRFIASFTHQAVVVHNNLLPSGAFHLVRLHRRHRHPRICRRSYRKLREGTLRKCVEFFGKFFQLIYLDTSRPNTTASTSHAGASSSHLSRVTPPGTVDSPTHTIEERSSHEGDIQVAEEEEEQEEQGEG